MLKPLDEIVHVRGVGLWSTIATAGLIFTESVAVVVVTMLTGQDASQIVSVAPSAAMIGMVSGPAVPCVVVVVVTTSSPLIVAVIVCPVV